MKKYNQNIRLETIGLKEVPASEKTTRWHEYAFIQAAFSVNTGNALVPALAVLTGGLSAGWAVAATVSGAMLAFLFVSLLALPGARAGLPAQYVIRTMIGSRLSMGFASPVRSFTSLYWFAVQSIGGSMVVQVLIESFFDVFIPLIVLAPSFSVIMAVLALIGFDAVKKTIKWFIPVLFLSQALMFYLLFTEAPAIPPSEDSFSLGSFLFFASLAFVQYVSGVSASSDITRYAASPVEGFTGVFIGNAIGFSAVSVLGAYFAQSLESSNPFIAAGSLAGSQAAAVLIALGAVISMISINLSNAYTGGYSLLNALPALGRVKSAVLFGAAGVALSFFPGIVREAESYISLLGAGIIPLSSIVCADYLITKKMQLTDADLAVLVSGTRYANVPAFLTILIAIPVYFLIPEAFSPGFLVFALAAVIYISLQKFVGVRAPAL